ncbi:hypothetical protein [Streptomyces niveiscabiei]|uniref:hypothetical protein n=1 Tax=Streptomyces niveiscabiei TaxID=164115 RepID=UPI0026790840
MPAPVSPAPGRARRLLAPVWHALALYGWFWLPGIPPGDLFDPPYPRDRTPRNHPAPPRTTP